MKFIKEAYEIVKEEGLDPFPTIVEFVDSEEMLEIVAKGGFKKRYSHWTFGMEYENIKKSEKYGLSKIYEIVINNDPCYAYFKKTGSEMLNKIIAVHVLAHSDFFKNNIWFSQTNRRMIHRMENSEKIVNKYIEKYGLETVENFINSVLSLDYFIDYHSMFIKRKKEKVFFDKEKVKEKEIQTKKLDLKPYMEPFINLKPKKEKKSKKEKQFEPEKDILYFLIKNAPLEDWERNIMEIIREDCYYFAPQRLTKIMNEGWAAYWHSKLASKFLESKDMIEYCDFHSKILGGGMMNPYKLGFELFKYIEDCWNKGKFGVEYAKCEDMQKKSNWDLKLNKGKEKIFEVRKTNIDLTFIDNFFTEEFFKNNPFYLLGFIGNVLVEIKDFKEIKKILLKKLENMGMPVIKVVDDNWENRKELYLKHEHDGRDLYLDVARKALENIFKMWKRTVHLETKISGKTKILTAPEK